jgi:NADH-quinone oxidoreductase subunit J
LASDALLFYLFAAVTVIGALVVVSQRNPVYSLLSLVGAFFGLCGLYVLLEAPFLAVVQIIVYAGAIMVLFLFVVMLLNAPREDVASPYGPAYVTLTTGPRKAFALLSLVLLVELAFIVGYYVVAAPASGPARAAHVSSVREIGVSIFTDYSLAFEATSVLILVAMVGAVVLAKKKL